MVGARIQIEQNKPVLEKATPFPPDGVTLLQDSYTLLGKRCSHFANYIVSCAQLHY